MKKLCMCCFTLNDKDSVICNSCGGSEFELTKEDIVIINRELDEEINDGEDYFFPIT